MPGLLLPLASGQTEKVRRYEKRISRNDVIFLAILLAVVTVFLVVYERTGTRADAGACVRVTVDGSVYGIYALGEEQEIPIVQDGVTTNVPTIRDGRADMTEAWTARTSCVSIRRQSLRIMR